MNDEQLRAEFEAWLYLDQTKYDPERMSKQEIEIAKLAYQAGRAALQSQDREDESCEWHNYPETDNVWDTDCGQSFEIYEGTPTENGMGFCCYCGKPIHEAIDHARRVEGDNNG